MATLDLNIHVCKMIGEEVLLCMIDDQPSKP